DLGQGVGAGDEVEVVVRTLLTQVTQGVIGECRTLAVDVHARDREAGVRGGGDDRHEVPVLGGTDRAVVLEVGLAGWHEHNLVQLEQRGGLAGRDQVAVVDGIEGATHHAQTHQWWLPVARPVPLVSTSSWSCSTGSSARVLRNDHSSPSSASAITMVITPYQNGVNGRYGPTWPASAAWKIAFVIGSRVPRRLQLPHAPGAVGHHPDV